MSISPVGGSGGYSELPEGSFIQALKELHTDIGNMGEDFNKGNEGGAILNAQTCISLFNQIEPTCRDYGFDSGTVNAVGSALETLAGGGTGSIQQALASGSQADKDAVNKLIKDTANTIYHWENQA